MMYYARSTPADMLLVKTSAVGKMKDFRSDARYFELVSSENSKSKFAERMKNFKRIRQKIEIEL